MSIQQPHISNRRAPRSRMLPVAGSFSAVIALFLTLWIVVPAPFSVLWLVALLASEWSIYIGLVGLLGATLGVVSVRRRWRRTGIAAIICGVGALGLSLYPLVAALPVAASNSVDLSLTSYLFGTSVAPSVSQSFVFSEAAGQRLRLDAYLPTSSTSSPTSTSGDTRRPAVVVVHGGSWTSGERSDFPEWDGWLAAQGYAVFDIDYRLTPQPNWQTAADDVRAAVVWVKDHAERFGIDPERVALLGRSAGGELALISAYTPRPGDSVHADSRVWAVVAFYAPTDLPWAYDHPANQRVIDGPATLRRFLGGSPEELPDVYEHASPAAHVDREAPPTLLFHGGRDQLVRTENVDRLSAAFVLRGVSESRCRVVVVPYAQHGFDYNFNGWGSQIARSVLLDFLNLNLSAAGP